MYDNFEIQIALTKRAIFYFIWQIDKYFYDSQVDFLYYNVIKKICHLLPLFKILEVQKQPHFQIEYNLANQPQEDSGLQLDSQQFQQMDYVWWHEWAIKVLLTVFYHDLTSESRQINLHKLLMKHMVNSGIVQILLL